MRHIGKCLAPLVLVASVATPQTPLFRAGTEVVALSVRVQDRQGRFVPALTPERFVVTERGRPRPVTIVSGDSEPLSLAIVVDASESMRGNRWRFAAQAVLALFASQRPQDEFYVFGFNDRVFPIAPGTQSVPAMQNALGRVQPEGATALHASILTAIDTLRATRHRRQAVVVISDGNDFLPSDARDPYKPSAAMMRASRAFDLVQRSNATVFAIAVDPDNSPGNTHSPFEPGTLQRLTDATGGSVHIVHSDNRIPEAARQVLTDLREQYLVGFEPAFSGDGKFHRIAVKVGDCDCRVRTRAGYVAAKRDDKQ